MPKDIKQTQIVCDINVQADRQIIIFDADNLFLPEPYVSEQSEQISKLIHNQDSQNKIVQQKYHEVQSHREEFPIDQQIISKLEQQIKNTGEKFFDISKINQEIKKNKNLKSLNYINQIGKMKPNSILKQGYMNKKTDGIIFKWKRRYFTLTPQKLFFFEDHKKEKVIGCVNIKIIHLQVRQEQQNEIIILDFLGQCENIILKVRNRQQRQQWKQWIQKVVQYQSNQKKIFLQTMCKPFYTQSNTISQRQFLSQAETGDILLFYTKNIGAKIQRVFTNSDFDHVAMVVKFRSYQVMVFQSNQTSGVALFQWSQYVRSSNRKLVSPRKQQIQHNLLKFVKSNLGRQFNLSLSKLFTLQSDFSWDLLNQDTERGFFCSELIAKTYKSIGLLDPVKSSCRYWPVDFSQKNDLKLLKGAYLGLQQPIVLNKHIKRIS